MKIFNIILALLFLSFAIVQFNDVDPLFWVPYYLFIAAVCAFAAFGKYNIPVLAIGVVGSLIGVLISAPGFWDLLINSDGISLWDAFSAEVGMKEEYPYIEVTREFGGMLIALIALCWLSISAARKNEREELIALSMDQPEEEYTEQESQ